MKITNISNVDGFFKVVDKCKGRVELTTPEGDRLNLKSQLTKFVVLAGLFENAKIQDAELTFSEPEDSSKILNFLVNGSPTRHN